MTPAILSEYHEQRATGSTASNALAMARHKQRIRDLGYDVEDGTRFKHQGFDVTIRVKPDQDVDLSWLGEFTGHPTGFAFKRPNASHREYQYFQPASDNGRNLAEYRKGWSELGYSKHAADCGARQHLRDDWKMAEDLNESGMFGVIVQVRRNGVALGESSVWSVDADWIPGAYLEYDLLGEAISEAHETLRMLCVSQHTR